MKCPKCNTNNPGKNKFCATCGSSLINLVIACPKCNTNNPGKSTFCGTCGTPLREPVDSTPRHLQRSTYSSLVEEAKQELEDLENVISTNVNAGLRHAEEKPVATIFTILRITKGISMCLTVYFIPYGIALFRNKNKLAIFALNFLLGWTVAGWVVALVWAIKKDTEAERTVQKPNY